MNVDDAMLMAYLDGELDEVTRQRIENALADDPELGARRDAQQRLKTRIAAHYDPVAEQPVPERFRALLDTNVVDFAAARAGRSRPLWQSAAALAATLVLGLFLGRTLPIGESGPIGLEQDNLVARGPLAEALNSQLASAQGAAGGDADRRKLRARGRQSVPDLRERFPFGSRLPRGRRLADDGDCCDCVRTARRLSSSGGGSAAHSPGGARDDGRRAARRHRRTARARRGLAGAEPERNLRTVCGDQLNELRIAGPSAAHRTLD